MLDPFETRRPLSVSQYKSFERCPYSWFLARVEKVWQRPAAWLPQGSAVHDVAEAWEKSGRTMTLDEALEVFRQAYKKHVDSYCEITPNLDWWSKSGPYGGAADIERRFNIGLDQVERFISYHLANPDHEIWTAPDGSRGIELAFDIELAGVNVRGFIDAIRVVDGEPRVVDYKTGNSPGDDFQLGVYRVALQVQYGVDVRLGEYWMARAGKPTYPFDLSDWTVETVGAKFRELDENIRAERFDPDPEPSKCLFCDVSYACAYRAV